MKKISLWLLVWISLINSIAFAHPWDDLENAQGCHHCRTNCANYGLEYWQPHCHLGTWECYNYEVDLIAKEMEDKLLEVQYTKDEASSRWMLNSSDTDKIVWKLNFQYSQLEIWWLQARQRVNDCFDFLLKLEKDNKRLSNKINKEYNARLKEFSNRKHSYDISYQYYLSGNFDAALDSIETAMINAWNLWDEYIQLTTEMKEILINWINQQETRDFINKCKVSLWTAFLDVNWQVQCNCPTWYIFDWNEFCMVQERMSNELTESISRMYNNWLTRYNSEWDFLANNSLTREQASKFFVEFAQKIRKMSWEISKQTNFNDFDQADNTLQSYILLSYQLGLFKWINWAFLPFNNLTRAQALAVLIRIKDWLQNEEWTYWYQTYYDLANSYWLLNDLGFSFDTLDQTYIERGEVALLLYRLSFIQ